MFQCLSTFFFFSPHFPYFIIFPLHFLSPFLPRQEKILARRRPSLSSVPGDLVQDEEAGKLFVGGLSWETSQDSLLRYFSRKAGRAQTVATRPQWSKSTT
jgi:hypothetical protein